MKQVLFLIKRMILLCLLSYFVLLLNGCAKTQYEEVWESSLSSCGTNCHEPGGTAADGPDMSSSDKFYSNVVGKTVTTDYPNWIKTSTCDDLKIIDAGSANNSSLVAALVQSVSDSQNCTTAFSFHTGEQVTDTDKTWSELVNWINDGAPKE